MLKNRHLQVKMVKDEAPTHTDALIREATQTREISDISDAVIHVAEEVSKTVGKVVVAYIVMDTWRKVTISVFSRG